MDLLSLVDDRQTDRTAFQSTSRQTSHTAAPSAAISLQNTLRTGRKITRKTLRDAMIAQYGGTDAEGAWVWKDAYEAVEQALCAHMLRVGPAMIADDPLSVLRRLEDLSALAPTHTRRTEESLRLQQFSTPLGLAYCAFLAGDISAGDIVLEPSAGNGALATMATAGGARVTLNEIDEKRASGLERLFRQSVHRHDAAHIDDFLHEDLSADVVLMNPPFAKSITRGDHQGEAGAHVWSAFKRLADQGRLVAIVPHSFVPSSARHCAFWKRLGETGRCRLAAGINGDVFRGHGTSIETRLIVIDKIAEGGHAEPIDCGDLTALIEVLKDLPPRPANLRPGVKRAIAPRRIDRTPPKHKFVRRVVSREEARPVMSITRRTGEPLAYSEKTEQDAASDDAGLYCSYAVQRIDIDGARPHPTSLTQSAALASVMPPLPSYTPTLPRRVVTDGILSGPQLESIIYAGEAHERFLGGVFTRCPETGAVKEAPDDDNAAFKIRMGYFIGDGTGCGKGRQAAGIVLDNWIKGRRKAVWISKSDKLYEDAVRDWTALGGAASDVMPQSRWKLGKTISAGEGVMFSTFATLRGGARDGKASRLDQLLDWLGEDFDGVIVFDEAHAMQNSMAMKGDRGEKKASRQGKVGVDLQMRMPMSRIVYASATGASAVENLAYAERLGLWRGAGAPFASKERFISEMMKGGVAAMEMVCRDLKAMGLYCARNLSFDGVEYAFLDHDLTGSQIEIYDAYAGAFKVIHSNLEKALEAMGVMEDGASRNKNAVGAARSAFESTKQRFFNHLLTAMKMPTLIKAIRADRQEGAASIVQIVSTGEAVMDRALNQLSAADLANGLFDATPRAAVMEYLQASFPTQLHRMVTDENGNENAEAVFDDEGNPVEAREAVALRDALIERLCALPPVTAALDQLIWTFGAEAVAEITGRSRRVVRKKTLGSETMEIERRPASVNIAETNAFMDGRKTILVFSEAGGTGRSYHADLSRENQRKRHHYLLEAGWKADAAVQGLGRSHRTNQACPPLFIPVRTDVKGEKRFLSTIARRLDALGALTRGERATGGQGMFRAEDNMESDEAKAALLIFFRRLAKAPQGGVSLKDFTDMTGLNIVDKDGSLLEQLPPIRRFLNRLLALPIKTQNTLFAVFEEIIENRIEAAMAAGTLDLGAETITAHSLQVVDNTVLRTDPATKAETRLLRIKRRIRTSPTNAKELIETLGDTNGVAGTPFHINDKSGRAAYVHPTVAFTDEETGAVHERVALLRPLSEERLTVEKFAETAWRQVSERDFLSAWEREVASLPEFTDDEFGLVAGLITPLWSLLTEKRPTVYRLTDDKGRTYLGRYVPPSMIGSLLSACSVGGAGVSFTGASALDAIRRGERVTLGEGPFLVYGKVMDMNRIEVRDVPHEWLDALKAMGCFTEVIQWRTRIFVPNDNRAEDIVDSILARFGATLSEAA